MRVFLQKADWEECAVGGRADVGTSVGSVFRLSNLAASCFASVPAEENGRMAPSLSSGTNPSHRLQTAYTADT